MIARQQQLLIVGLDAQHVVQALKNAIAVAAGLRQIVRIGGSMITCSAGLG